MYWSCSAFIALDLPHVALGHLVALGDQVDEDTEEGQQDHEDEPDGLHATPDIAATEKIREDPEQDP